MLHAAKVRDSVTGADPGRALFSTLRCRSLGEQRDAVCGTLAQLRGSLLVMDDEVKHNNSRHDSSRSPAVSERRAEDAQQRPNRSASGIKQRAWA